MNEKWNYPPRMVTPVTLFLLASMMPLQAEVSEKTLAEYVTLQASAQQQQQQVSGKIVDDSGETLIGANVIIKGTSIGTVTDYDGNFTLENVPAGAVLVISHIGYQPQEVTVKPGKFIDVTLSEDSQMLEEYVVVGYGTMRKSDVTGSISNAKGEDILKQQSFGALDGLKGKVSGVNIFTNSGQPGGGSRVIIRGIGTINSSSEPLYVVDGVVMDNFKYLNPNDIESIEVLKDASSSAIYGARGANGVILVTTKRGYDGEGVEISYNGSIGLSHVQSYMDVMNSEEYMRAYQIGLNNAVNWYGLDISTDLADHFTDPRFFRDGKPIYDTDWQKESTRTAVSHNHQLNIQQGTKNSSMGAFLNYTDQQGVMLNSYMKRVNGKLAFDANPTKWLTTGINLLVNHTWGNEVDEGGGNQVPRRSMIEMVPWLPVKLEDGSWTNSNTSIDKLGLEGIANPVHVLETQKRMRYRTQIFGNAALTFHLAPGLDLKTQFGLDKQLNKDREYSPTDLINLSFPQGEARIADYNSMYWQEETFLTYNKNWGLSRLNAMAGLSWQQYTYRQDIMSAKGFADDFFGWDNMGTATNPSSPSSYYSKWAMNSYFLRAAYSYADKYMATVTGRVDGSSKFGDNNKYAFFPSAGLGWVMSEEGAFQDFSKLDFLKLHTSYGVTGNSEIGTYGSLATVTSGSVLQGGGRVPSSYVNSLANPNLKWEKTNQFDVGVNAGFFSNRLNFDVSYYYKLTKDLLLARPVPHTTGFSSVIDNIGSVSNQGVDFMMNTVNITNKNFNWTSTVNLNFNKNRIEALGENDEDIFPGPWWVSGSQVILRKGESLGAFWGYEREGIWTEAEAAEAKANGQNVGQAKRSKEKHILGDGIPDLTGSFSNNFQYKNFDLAVELQFATCVEVLQQFTHSTEDRFGVSNGTTSILDGWRPDNQNTLVQAIRLANTPAGQSSELDSRWVADGSYLRGSLIQLGYTMNPTKLKKTSLSSLRVYLSVNNAFLIHSKEFRGYDPEGSSQGGHQWGQNMYFFQYPTPRTFTLGVNVSF